MRWRDEGARLDRNQCGLGDSGLLESALAAAYVVGIIRNHPFVDGNKRTGFMTGYVFLSRNNRQLTASEFEATRFVSALASGELQEEAFADWLRNNTMMKESIV